MVLWLRETDLRSEWYCHSCDFSVWLPAVWLTGECIDRECEWAASDIYEHPSSHVSLMLWQRPQMDWDCWLNCLDFIIYRLFIIARNCQHAYSLKTPYQFLISYASSFCMDKIFFVRDKTILSRTKNLSPRQKKFCLRKNILVTI